MRQQTTSQDALVRSSGLTVERITELRHGKAATAEELEALAVALRSDVASLKAAIAYEQEIEAMPF